MHLFHPCLMNKNEELIKITLFKDTEVLTIAFVLIIKKEEKKQQRSACVNLEYNSNKIFYARFT